MSLSNSTAASAIQIPGGSVPNVVASSNANPADTKELVGLVLQLTNPELVC
jgi:hypothetical protein